MLDRKISSIFGKTKKSIIVDETARSQINEAKLLMEKGAWGTVSLIVTHLVEQYPEEADCNWLNGRLLSNQGKFNQSIYHFKKCLKSNPKHADCYFRYGAVLGVLNKCVEEEQMYKQCLQLYPSHHECHYNYGLLLEIKGKYKFAEEHFKEAIQINSKDYTYYLGYAKLLKQLRRFQESKQTLDTAMLIDPNNDRIHSFYGKLMEATGELDDALMYIKKAIKLDPRNKEYQRYLHGLVRKTGAIKKEAEWPTVRKSASRSVSFPKPKTTTKVTPGGPISPQLQELLDNKPDDNNQKNNSSKKSKTKTKTQRSQTASKLKTFASDSKLKPVIESETVMDEFTDKYLQKAKELYQANKYEAAQQILTTILLITPDNETALNLNKNIIENNNAHQCAPGQNPTDEDDDDNKETKIKQETINFTDHCQEEFVRFLEDRVKIQKFYPDLYDRFEQEGYNDIRYVLDLDKEILEKEIKLKKLHTKAFLRKINVFKSEVNAFQHWLKKIVSVNQQYTSMDKLIDTFENQGILTFESLYRYVLCQDDLIGIIGKEFRNVHRILWKEICHQQSELMQSVTADVNPAYSTAGQHPMSDDDNDNDDNMASEGATSHTSPAYI